MCERVRDPGSLLDAGNPLSVGNLHWSRTRDFVKDPTLIETALFLTLRMNTG
jgi:hypothetical protein